MKRIVLFFVLFLSSSIAIKAADVEVTLDPRIELLNCVWSLANDSNVVIDHVGQLDQTFKPFKEHDAVLALKNHYPMVRITKHMLPLLALQLQFTDDGELVYMPQSATLNRWASISFPGDEMTELLAQLTDFYKRSHFSEYFDKLQHTKQNELDGMNSHIKGDKKLQSIADYFGKGHSKIDFFVSYSTSDSLYGIPYVVVDGTIMPIFADRDMEMNEMNRELGHSILANESRPLSSALIEALVIDALSGYPMPDRVGAMSTYIIHLVDYPYAKHGISVFNFHSKWMASLVEIEVAGREREHLIEQAVNNGFPWQAEAVEKMKKLKSTLGSDKPFHIYIPQLYTLLQDCTQPYMVE